MGQEQFVAIMPYISSDLVSLIAEKQNISEEAAIKYFINQYLVFDKNGVAGIKLKLNDTLFINSGIKIALPHGYAGVYLNKSGKGNAGFDVRAEHRHQRHTLLGSGEPCVPAVPEVLSRKLPRGKI